MDTHRTLTYLAALSFLFQVMPTKARPSEPPVYTSCQVRVADGVGSGVIVRRGPETFVWTAGHVTEVCQKVDPKGVVSYDTVVVRVEDIAPTGTAGQHDYFAEVIRHSTHSGGGHDLALLRLRMKDSGLKGALFAPDAPPGPGRPIWVIGGHGLNLTQAVSLGNFSRAGILKDINGWNNKSGRVMDQIAGPALAGCSGGGVFTKKGGKCIGLLTEGLEETGECLNLIVPVRRMREYGREADCLWAIDEGLSLPHNLAEPSKVTHIPPKAAATTWAIPSFIFPLP